MMKKQLMLAAAALTATACIAGCGSSDNAGAAKENATRPAQAKGKEARDDR